MISSPFKNQSVHVRVSCTTLRNTQRHHPKMSSMKPLRFLACVPRTCGNKKATRFMNSLKGRNRRRKWDMASFAMTLLHHNANKVQTNTRFSFLVAEEVGIISVIPAAV